MGDFLPDTPEIRFDFRKHGLRETFNSWPRLEEVIGTPLIGVALAEPLVSEPSSLCRPLRCFPSPLGSCRSRSIYFLKPSFQRSCSHLVPVNSSRDTAMKQPQYVPKR